MFTAVIVRAVYNSLGVCLCGHVRTRHNNSFKFSLVFAVEKKGVPDLSGPLLPALKKTFKIVKSLVGNYDTTTESFIQHRRCLSFYLSSLTTTPLMQ